MFACLLVLVVAVETSGLARAIGPSATVHCCCGPHASARPCDCPDCPATLRRAAHHDLGAARLTADHCDGHSASEPGVLRVLAVVTPLVLLAAPELRGFFAFAPPSPLGGRAVDIGRPPP